jgi:3-phosphoshikimate 1-carboxyvinyltransferase
LVSILIEKSRIGGTLRCPSSKSYTHRAIAIASLAEGKSIINKPLLSRDTIATLSASSAFGAKIIQHGSRLVVAGTRTLHAPDDIINAENSGTTLRIFTVMAALVKKGFTILTGDASLRKRPMKPVLDALTQLGVECHSSQMNGFAPLLIKGGGIRGGNVTIQGNISSQFLSSLLISTIYARSPVSIHVRGEQVSKPYIKSTITVMKKFGVTIDYEKDFLEYHIEKKKYRPTEFDVPADFSTAALLLAAGVLAGRSITLKGLDFSIPQADSKILEILKEMNAEISINKNQGEVKVVGTEILDGGTFDLIDSPDLLPVVSILALKAKSPVVVTGVSHTRLKETDRVANIASQIKKFGARVNEEKDKLMITAPQSLQNSTIQAFKDHRLFMAFAIASLLTEKSVVEGAEHVDVSYPNFLSDLMKLGARIGYQ